MQFTPETIRKYFKIPYAQFYNVDINNEGGPTIPFNRNNRQYPTLSMQEILFYMDIAKGQIEQYCYDTINLTHKEHTVDILGKFDDYKTVKGKRFVTGLSQDVLFGKPYTQTYKSDGVIRISTTKYGGEYRDKFFAHFTLPPHFTDEPIIITAYNGTHKIVIEDIDRNDNLYVITGNSHDVMCREMVENRSFSNQKPLDVDDPTIYVTEITLNVTFIDSSQPSGYLNYELSKLPIDIINGETPGIAQIVGIEEHSVFGNPESISFWYASQIQNKNVIKAACLLFGTLVPPELVYEYTDFYKLCIELQKDTTKIPKSQRAVVLFDYLYSPFGISNGSVEAFRLLTRNGSLS